MNKEYIYICIYIYIASPKKVEEFPNDIPAFPPIMVYVIFIPFSMVSAQAESVSAVVQKPALSRAKVGYLAVCHAIHGQMDVFWMFFG